MSNAATARFAAILLAGMILLAPVSRAQEPKFDSDSISGLGARNIGSATMSGRVSALAAVKEDGRLTVYIGAASGGVWKSVRWRDNLQAGLRQTARAIDRRHRHRSAGSQNDLGRNRRSLDP